MIFWEDVEVGAVSHFGNYHVTREEIIEFASRYDPQPFHLDDQAAKMSLFGKLCASGWHSCAMTMRMVVDEMLARQNAALGSPGVENLVWPKPVFPGDTLSVRAEVLEKRLSASRPQVGLVRQSSSTLNQHGEEVMRFSASIFFLRRPLAQQQDQP